jgi:hypothetical protein
MIGLNLPAGIGKIKYLALHLIIDKPPLLRGLFC